MPGLYESPVPENRPGMATVQLDDGEQEGETLELATFDELIGGVH
ncbi:hypothetical protein GCM10010149_88730 [Nonomuraea roseoviolacea subsp. roseoviolacea]